VLREAILRGGAQVRS